VLLGVHPFGRGTLTAMSLALLFFLAVPLAADLAAGGAAWAPVASLVVAVPLYATAVWLLRARFHLFPRRAAVVIGEGQAA